MLLQHPWLKSLTKPETIAEDAEGEEAAAHGDELADATAKLDINGNSVYDREVAEWVHHALDLKNKGLLDGDKSKAETVRPALHAAPLDSVSPLNSPAIGWHGRDS